MPQLLRKTVLLVAWEPARSRAWQRELADHDEWAVLAPVHAVCLAQAQLNQQRPDLLITDLRMPDGTAIDLVRSLRHNHPARAGDDLAGQILVMTQGPDALLLEALQEGADNFLDDAELGANPLSRHARDTLTGGAHMAPWVARRLLDYFGVYGIDRPHPGQHEGFSPLELSRAERQLLRQLSIGQRLADVAHSLGLAPRDGAARVRSIYRKMQWALRAGDLTLSPGR